MRRVLPFVLLAAVACTHHRSAAEVERFDQPDRAAEFFAAKRGITSDTHLGTLYNAARMHMQSMQRFSTTGDRIVERGRNARILSNAPTTTAVGWTSLGPGNIGGRTRALVFDPTDPNTMYAGAVSGGVWKTTDAGGSWTPVGDELANLAVNSLVIDRNDPRTLFAGTGEGYYREDVRGTALPIRGDGIYVTHDGGASWAPLAFTQDNSDFQWVNKLAISPHNSNRIYAATRSGVWRSVDAGITWTRVLATTVKGGATDLVMRSDTAGDYLFAATGVFEQATVWRNQHAEQDGAYQAVLNDAGLSRTSLAIAPSNPSIIYALAASNTKGPQNTTQNLQAVYRSDQNGDPGTWQVRASITDPTGTLGRLLLSNPVAAISPQCDNSRTTAEGEWVPMGWHCNTIAVDPTNPDRVWAAGVDLFRSDDGGRTWGAASYWWIARDQPQFVHADQHVIAFHPRYDGGANQTLFAANDGGIFRTDNANAATAAGVPGLCDATKASVHWTSLNHNYGVTQFYFGTVFPDGRKFIGGAQDNGTLIGTAGSNNWQMTFSGDGSNVAVDPVDPTLVFTEYQYGALLKSKDGGTTWRGADLPSAGDSSQFLFVTPFVIDPNNHRRIWIGGASMWRSDNEAESRFAAAGPQLPAGAMFSAIAVAPGRSDRVIAGTNAGDILRTDTATTANVTTAWSSVRPRAGYVSSIAFDTTNSDIVYATYAGFGGAHVFRSIDGGATWSPLDGTGDGALPDIPVHSLVADPYHPHRIYIGTDTGIFVTLDDGAHWLVEEGGFAAVITESLVLGRTANGTPALYAFTHGRGAWRAELVGGGPRRRAVAH
jgi:photosystem II stability/assembly factor-like uncharacterized protein